MPTATADRWRRQQKLT